MSHLLNKTRSILAAFSLFFLASILNAGTLKDEYFALVYKVSDAFATVELNGVPVVTKGSEPFKSGQMQVNEWVLPGSNTLSLNVQAADKIQDKPSFTLELYLVKAGQFPDEGKKLFSTKWPETPSNQSPWQKSLAIQLVDVPPSQLFEKGAVITLGENEKSAVKTLVLKLFESLEKKNKEAFTNLTGFQAAENARLRYVDPEMYKKKSVEMLPKLFEKFSGKLGKPKSEDWSYQLVMGSRLVRVTEKSGKSPISFETKDSGMSLPVFAAKIDGQWVLAR